METFGISTILAKRLSSVQQNDSLVWAEVTALTAVQQWHVKLKDFRDHQAHTPEVVIPGMPRGRYVLLASTGSHNSYKGQLFGYTTIQVTNIATLEFASGNEHHY